MSKECESDYDEDGFVGTRQVSKILHLNQRTSLRWCADNGVESKLVHGPGQKGSRRVFKEEDIFRVLGLYRQGKPSNLPSAKEFYEFVRNKPISVRTFDAEMIKAAAALFRLGDEYQSNGEESLGASEAAASVVAYYYRTKIEELYEKFRCSLVTKGAN